MPPHLTPIIDIIKDLEKQVFDCPWDRLEFIHSRIAAYQAKLARGITHEPDF